MSRTLKVGDFGEDVKQLQIKVAGWSTDTPQQIYVATDGRFNKATEEAIKRFQKSYGLVVDGIAGPQTLEQLTRLEDPDGSTKHFNWSEFLCKGSSSFSGGKIAATTIVENIRRLMWKLEALRVKANNQPITIISGFRSITHNANVGGAANSLHTYGVATDIAINGLSVTQVNNLARTCGFSGIYNMANATHVDSRIEYPYNSQSWWWNYEIK